MKQKLKQMSSGHMTMESLADIYYQLAHLEDSGISAQQAFTLINTKQDIKNVLFQVERLLASGGAIADAGHRAGVFRAFDKELIAAGEASGNLATIYRQLATYYGDKVKRNKKMKSKLYLPLFTLVLAFFIQPLPSLILGNITAVDYLLASMGKISLLLLTLYLVFKIPYWLMDGTLGFLALDKWIFRLQLSLPVISSWIVNRQKNVFFTSLAMMLDAGLPALTALPKAINTIKNPVLKKQFSPLISLTENGQSLTESCTQLGLLDPQAIQIVLVGEKSGTLAQTLLHFASIETEKYNLQEDLLSEWIPRIFYFFVAAWVASSIIGTYPNPSLNL